MIMYINRPMWLRKLKIWYILLCGTHLPGIPLPVCYNSGCGKIHSGEHLT